MSQFDDTKVNLNHIAGRNTNVVNIELQANDIMLKPEDILSVKQI